MVASSTIMAIALIGCGREPVFAPAEGIGVQARVPEPPSRSGPRFVDRAKDYGLNVATRHGSAEKTSALDALGAGVAILDHDGDGDLDLLILPGSEVRDGKLASTGGPWLFRNDGPGRWTDVTKDSGLRYSGLAQGVAVADYDGDDDLDMFWAQHGPDVLWRNKGDGVFEDVTKEAGLGSDTYWGVSATWGDYDGDGFVDLYVTNYLVIDSLRPPPLIEYLPGLNVFQGPVHLPGEPDALWRNKGDGTFENVTARAGLGDPTGKGMSALFADFTGDGRPDLYITNDTQSNQFFRNLGEGKFREEAGILGVSVSTLGAAEGSMAIDAADLDGDGKLDLVHSNFRHEGTRVHQNLGDRGFLDVSAGSTIGTATLGFVGWGLVLGDFDDDGLTDFFQANGHVYPKVVDSRYDQPPILMRNLGGMRFEDMTQSWGESLESLTRGRGVAQGDLDGDGDLDIVMTTMDGPLRVLINEGPRQNNSVAIRLIGNKSNREDLGATVTVEAGGRTRTDQVRRGGSIMSASDVSLHFGLGTADVVDRVTVRRPDGSTSVHEKLPVNSHVTIRRDDPRVAVRPFHRP